MIDNSVWLERLQQKKDEGLLRSLSPLAVTGPSKIKRNGVELVDFVSNDYLGLAGHAELVDAYQNASLKWGTGSRGSRLLGGDHEGFHEVELWMTQWKYGDGVVDREALLLPNGYMANLAVVGALCDKNTTCFCDRFLHASFMDGVRLAGAKLQRFTHNSAEDLGERLSKTQGPCVILVESLYSMDGDLSPLVAIADLAQRYGAMLVVDEAHAEGVLGPDGKGLVHQLGLQEQVDVVIGTFGKAFGVAGACVWTHSVLKQWMVNAARPLIYSTAMSPVQAWLMRSAVQLSMRESWRRQRVLQLANELRQSLVQAGNDTMSSQCQIIPVQVGDNHKALAFSESLMAQGIWVAAIRPPTVPAGTARLRINLSATHTENDLERLLLGMGQ